MRKLGRSRVASPVLWGITFVRLQIQLVLAFLVLSLRLAALISETLLHIRQKLSQLWVAFTDSPGASIGPQATVRLPTQLSRCSRTRQSVFPRQHGTRD